MSCCAKSPGKTLGSALLVIGLAAVVIGLVGFKADRKHADEDRSLALRYGANILRGPLERTSASGRMAMWRKVAYSGITIGLAGLGVTCAFHGGSRRKASATDDMTPDQSPDLD
jgi:hypothetical protein